MGNSKSRIKLATALVVVASLTIGVVAALSLSGATKHKPKPKPKAINLSGVTLNVGDIFGAAQVLFNDSGALKGAQYKVNFTTFSLGPPDIAAIQGGAIDLTVTADTPAIFAQAGGVPLKVVAVTQPVVPGDWLGIVVLKGSSITSLAQLKGQKIAAASGTIMQYLAIQALNGSIGSYNNATLVNLFPSLALSALTSGSVQAAVLVQPFLADAVSSGARVITLGTPYTKGYSYYLAANAALADAKKTAAIADYLRRVGVAQHWAATHLSTWAQDYSSAYNISTSLAAAAVDSELASFVKIGAPEYNSLKNEGAAFQAAGLLTTPVNTGTLFSTQFNSIVSSFLKG